ncbi:hypothetical protein C3V41_08410 [Actinomyces sp. oral taxon 897]|nr:hypothetical protein C3V41_08410 [Actinomyces sp. oral taxon 897]
MRRGGPGGAGPGRARARGPGADDGQLTGTGRVAGRKGPGRETRLITCGWVRVRWSGRGR